MSPSFDSDLITSQLHDRLKTELRRARLSSGKTVRQLADQLGWSASKVSRLEVGTRKPPPREVGMWLVAVGAPEAKVQELTDLALHVIAPEVTQKRERRTALGDDAPQADWALREAAAGAITIFQPVIYPGLVQTAEYARRVLQFAGISTEGIAKVVADRLERQQVLYSGKPVRLVVLEEALRRRVAPDPVMLGQVDRLASMATLQSVAVHLVPADAPMPALPWTQFELLDDEDGAGVVAIETVATELTLEDADSLAEYRGLIEAWRKVALTGGDARALLERVRGQFLPQGGRP